MVCVCVCVCPIRLTLDPFIAISIDFEPSLSLSLSLTHTHLLQDQRDPHFCVVVERLSITADASQTSLDFTIGLHACAWEIEDTKERFLLDP
jgi:hypothetical protein